MPILGPEPDYYPAELWEPSQHQSVIERHWNVVYTLSRQEKVLMRKLNAAKIWFYGPMIKHRHRSPGGRIRESYLPLFPGYVFICCTAQERLQILQTNLVSRWLDVSQPEELLHDLKNLQLAISADVPMTTSAKLIPGDLVKVTSGVLAGVEGTIVRRTHATELIVAVNFLQQGASLELDETDLELLIPLSERHS